MSGAAKKRPTELVLKTADETRAFKIPPKDKGKVLKFLQKYEEETLPWRETKAFKNRIKEVGPPAMALRGARLKEGLTQIELAEKTGVQQHNISAMENGKRPIGKAMAKRLAEALNIGYKVFL